MSIFIFYNYEIFNDIFLLITPMNRKIHFSGGSCGAIFARIQNTVGLKAPSNIPVKQKLPAFTAELFNSRRFLTHDLPRVKAAVAGQRVSAVAQTHTFLTHRKFRILRQRLKQAKSGKVRSESISVGNIYLHTPAALGSMLTENRSKICGAEKHTLKPCAVKAGRKPTRINKRSAHKLKGSCSPPPLGHVGRLDKAGADIDKGCCY